jgi:hypothetical protein
MMKMMTHPPLLPRAPARGVDDEADDGARDDGDDRGAMIGFFASFK